MNKIFVTILLLATFYEFLAAQTEFPLPPHFRVFTQDTRGFWFTAPCDFEIQSLKVPEEAGSDPQSVVVFKFNAPPPTREFDDPGSTKEFTTLALYQGIPGFDSIPVSIPIMKGEIIGVLGSRGVDASNSYSTNQAPFNYDFFGMPIELNRLFMYDDLENVWPDSVSASPPGFEIGRIEMTVEKLEPIPTFSQWGIMILFVFMLIFGVVVLKNYNLVQLHYKNFNLPSN